MNPSTATLLKNLNIFSSLDDAAISQLSAHCRRRKFRAGEALFHEGDPGLTLYVIISGSVNIQRDTAAGTTVHLARRGPGDPFGEMALIDGKPRMADAVTATPTEFLILDREAFIQCVQQSPRIAFGVMGYLADRLREAGSQLESHQSLDVRGRLAEKLLHLVAAHGKEEADGGIRIDTRVTQQGLAEQVGATRETVNRELARMRDVRAIQMDGRTIVITNQKKLEQYAEP
jgi:CRP-like cAMP-binding protein